MIRNHSRRDLSTRFRPSAEALEGRSLMAAIGQISLYIPSAPVGLSIAPVRGTLPDGSISVDSFDVGTGNPTSIGSATSGAGAGKATFSPLEVIIPVGPQSAALLQTETVGAHFNTATLTVRDGAARVLETLSFKFVIISSITTSGSAGDELTEDVKLVYGAIQDTTYNVATAAPQFTSSFSVVENAPVFDVPGVTASSLSKASVATASGQKAQAVSAKTVSTAIPTTIKLNVAKPHHGTTVLTATVASKQGVPSGNVTFYSGTIELGQVAVGANGKASLSVPTALIGKTKPFAIFSGGPDSTFQPSTTVTSRATYQKAFEKWLGRPMTQDEWVLTSIWSQQGYSVSKMTGIYKSLATRSS